MNIYMVVEIVHWKAKLRENLTSRCKEENSCAALACKERCRA